jgi:16S rRNA (cytidine1402-2'-O)-methyltransferase
MLNADLHCHSNVSDGMLPPAEVAARAQANGVELWALTDHDELGGLAEAAAAAHDLGLAVVPLVGPVSLLLALAASGLNGQQFAFVGYLPQELGERAARLRQLEGLALKTGQTQMWIETPYRNPAMLASLLQTLQPGTRLAIASGLTLATARIHSRSIAAWKKTMDGPDAHTPAVFAIGA